MSDEMKNCCPPETKAPKMHVHEAGERTEDIKPTTITTAHKKLSQDEFQRKVAMAAQFAALIDTEKSSSVAAGVQAVAGLGAAAARARAAASLAQKALAARSAGGAAAGVAKSAPWLSRLKGLFSRGVKSAPGAGAAATSAAPITSWAGRAKDYAKWWLHPYHLVAPAATAAGGVGLASLPYVGGGLQRAGAWLAGRNILGGDNPTGQGMGNAATLGLLGAGLGGVAGALMPGEEEYEDENGRMRKRRGSMLAGALRGAGLGGLAGGAAGLGVDHFGKMSAALEFGSAVANLEKKAVGPFMYPPMQPGNTQPNGNPQFATKNTQPGPDYTRNQAAARYALGAVSPVAGAAANAGMMLSGMNARRSAAGPGKYTANGPAMTQPNTPRSIFSR